MNRFNLDGEEYLTLASAAMQTYHRVMGPDTGPIRHLDDSLDFVGHALSNVAPIYVLDGSGLRQILPVQLVQATLSEAATILTLKDGSKISGLMVNRKDLRSAVAILIGAKARFET